MESYVKKIIVIYAIIVCFAGSVGADLTERIDGIINPYLQKKVTFSIHVIKADTGREVYGHQSQEPRIPASNMKIITSAAALKYLGPDYEFTTKIGLCNGSLIIIGSGDPLLGDAETDLKYGREKDWVLDTIVQALKLQGIETIEDIVVDSSIFDNQRVHPSWPAKDLNKSYACEISGLNYNCNCITISTERIEDKVAVYIEPQTGFIELINKIEPITQGESAVGTYRNSKPNKITAYGKCKNKVGPFEVAIERPAAFFGFLLYEKLTQAGISTKGKFVEAGLEEYGEFKPVTQFQTPLMDCVARCNKDSIGLVAESLLKTIAANSNPDGKNGSWEKGRELISNFLSELGVDKNQFNIDDGSGLSRENRLSAYVITTVLSNIYKSNYWPPYRDSLAVGGEDGTINKYFKEDKYRGKIIGKTGYISGVRSFSGVCTTENGDYIFSIIANNAGYISRYKINEIAESIIDEYSGSTK